MAKKLVNRGAGTLNISDERQDGIYRADIILAPYGEETITDEKYANITVPVSVSVENLNSIISTADAPAAAGTYTQADIQEMVDLINELKAAVNLLNG